MSPVKQRIVDVDGLLEELDQLSLTEVDVWRAAFCAITVYKGWNIAQIGRYLGVSRERVRQRIERLQKHTETYEMPILTELLKKAKKVKPLGTPDIPVGFPADSWMSEEFSLGLIRLVAGGD